MTMPKHACSAECPCPRGRELAMAKRVALRHFHALELGRGTFTDHLKLHHFHGSLRITDMQNAGKRGKKVKELTLRPNTLNEDLCDRTIKHAVGSILHMTYDQAKSHLEEILAREGHGTLFKLDEQELRGIDVEPRGTTINLEKKFPDGTIVRITSSPHDFLVTNSAVISAPGKAADGYRQDTLYHPRSKQDGILFYGWLQDNLSKAANMTIQELMAVWDSLGVRYDYH